MEAVEAGEQEESKERRINQREGRVKKKSSFIIYFYTYVLQHLIAKLKFQWPPVELHKALVIFSAFS